MSSELVFLKKTRSEEMVSVSRLPHGRIVWVAGETERQERVVWEGELLTQEERAARVRARAQFNRRANPYHRAFQTERSGHSLRWCF